MVVYMGVNVGSRNFYLIAPKKAKALIEKSDARTAQENRVSNATGPIARRMAEKLEAAFAPSLLQISDESHHHAGHSGSRPEGESHFRIRIAAPALAGLSRVNQHRKVNEVLAEELKARVHALAIEVVKSA